MARNQISESPAGPAEAGVGFGNVSENRKTKFLKTWEQELLKREQDCSDSAKQLTAVKTKMIQQEHLVNELESCKKLLETELLLSKRVGGDCPTVQPREAYNGVGRPLTCEALSSGPVEMKLLILEQRMQFLEADNIIIRQESLRAEQQKVMEMQQELARQQMFLKSFTQSQSLNNNYGFPFGNASQIPQSHCGMGLGH